MLTDGLLGNKEKVLLSLLLILINLSTLYDNRSWNGSPVKMYLNTDSSSPFCTFHYQLEIQLATRKRARNAEDWVQGYLRLTLIGEKDSLLDYDLTAGFVGNKCFLFPIISISGRALFFIMVDYTLIK